MSPEQGPQHPPTYEAGVDLAWQANEAYDAAKKAQKVTDVVRDAAGAELRAGDMMSSSPTYGEAYRLVSDVSMTANRKFNTLSDTAGDLMTSQADLEARAQDEKFDMGVDEAWRANRQFDDVQKARARVEAARELAGSETQAGDMLRAAPTYGAAYGEALDSERAAVKEFEFSSDLAGDLMASRPDLEAREQQKSNT